MNLLLALCLLAQVPGSIETDPALGWYTIRTEHFAIHFSSPDRTRPADDDERLARRVAGIAEAAHRELTASSGWTPRERTQIVIADFFDYANGWASPLPQNTITVIPTMPAGSRSGFDDHLRSLVFHEYAHIVQMDMIRGLPAVLRAVFGRIVLTNPVMPIWLLEGWAQMAETDHTAFGRLRSTEYDMQLRAAADSGRLLPIDRCATYDLERYPGGAAPYLYGGPFNRYLAHRFGDTVWNRFHMSHAGGLPFFADRHARRAFGASFPRLWRDWQSTVKTHANAVGHRLARTRLTPLRRVTHEGYYTGSPCWSADGSEIYYLSRDYTEYPAIKAIGRPGEDARVLHRGLVHGQMSLGPDGQCLAFAERNRYRDFYDYSDLFLLDLAQGTTRRLTTGLRARDPDFSPDGDRLVFVVNRHGTNDLALLDLATGAIDYLTETTEPTGFSRPKFSPDGRHVAVSINRPAGRTDIELLDTGSGWFRPVTDDRAIDLTPCWSSDGSDLYFISDRTGVFNLYAWSVASEELRRCTNLLYGAFEPALGPGDNTVALAAHGPNGIDICVTRIDPTAWTPAAGFIDTLPTTGYDHTTRISPLEYYDPLPTLGPRLWLPFALYDGDWSFGALTFGWDPLQFHNYTAMAGYRFGNTPFLNFSYTLSRFRPRFRLDTDLTLPGQSATLTTTVPFRSTRSSTHPGVYVNLRHDSGLTARAGAWLTGSSAFRYRFRTAAASGMTFTVSTDAEHSSALGARTRLRLYAGGSRYFALGFNHATLRTRAGLGTGFGDTSADSSFTIEPGPSTLGVRGFNQAAGPFPRAAAAGLELRMPLAWIERGGSTAPLFLSNLNAALFADWGIGWQNTIPNPDDFSTSRLGTGVELRADLILAYAVPVRMFGGVGFSLRPNPGTVQLYFGIRSSLLEGLTTQPDLLNPRPR